MSSTRRMRVICFRRSSRHLVIEMSLCAERLASRAAKLVCIWAFIFFVIAPVMAGPHALVPIPKPHFTIDLVSPSIGKPTTGGPITAGAILDAPGPVVTYAASGLRLFHPADELDEMSGNRIDVGVADKFVILFGVDRASVGARGPDPSLLPSRPFNVLDQAMRHQAAGDTFMTLDLYTRSGGPLPLEGFRLLAAKNNTLVINQGDTGGGDYDMIEDVSPLMDLPPGTPIDNGDGIYYEPVPPLWGGVPQWPAVRDAVLGEDERTGAERGIAVYLYFTLSRNSPSLAQLPPPGSGANVYVDSNPNTPFTENLYVTAAQLGLTGGPTGDDIDGLMVFDGGVQGVFNAGTDQVIFSLTPNSPSLGFSFSAADLFTSNGGGVFALYATADDLGLLPSDNVDNLELIKTTNAATTAFNSAIYYVIPGDFDGDGVLTADDCGQFAGCYTGEGGVATLPCESFDQDADGDVDCLDWRNNTIIFKQLNGGAVCPPLSVPEFVSALLGSPLVPAHECMADMNLDGKANGADVGPYVKTVLGP